MRMCNVGHEEIVYEGRYCPVCEVIREKYKDERVLNGKIAILENKVERLENETHINNNDFTIS